MPNARSATMIVMLAFAAPATGENEITVSICEEAEIILTHPAEYVQEKVKRNGISCLLLPHCCTPAWVAAPECYVVQWTLERDAWQEIKTTYTCSNFTMTPEEAFERWLAHLGSPATAVGFSFLTGGIDQLFKLYLTAAAAAATPLPNDIRTELEELVLAQAVPFTNADIASVKYLESDHPLGQRLFPGGDRNAITFQNLIIVDEDDYLRAPTTLQERCARLKEWAHELTHVHQYNQFGFDVFVGRYIEQSAQGYEDMPVESEAFIIEEKIGRECLLSQYATLKQFSPIVSGALSAQFLSDLSTAINSGQATVNADGSLESVELHVREELERKYKIDVVDQLINEANRPALPDLVVNEARIDPIGGYIAVRISNIGTAPATDFEVEVGLADDKLGARTRLTGASHVKSLEGGESITLRQDATQMDGYSESAARSVTRLHVAADATDVVRESDESNNRIQKSVRSGRAVSRIRR